MSLALRPTLALVLASFAAFSPLRAQEVSVAPNSVIARCVNWMNATVPAKVDPADFCAGIKQDTQGVGGQFLNAGGRDNKTPAVRSNTALRQATSRRGRRGALGFARQPEMDMNFSAEPRRPERARLPSQLRFTAAPHCRWEASGLLRGCTISCHPNHPRAGNLGSPNGAMCRIPRVI